MVQNSQPPYSIVATQEVHTTRALGVLYTNTTGRTMFLNVSAYFVVNVAGGYGTMQAEVDGVVVSKVNTSSSGSLLNSDGAMTVAATVKSGSTYKIVNAVNNVSWTLTYWNESY